MRATTLQNNSLNGIWIRPELTGIAEATDAMSYPDNPASLGGSINYTLDAPLPYILTSATVHRHRATRRHQPHQFIAARLYVQPGVMIKSQQGASIGVDNPSASLNVGDRTYINEWDLNHNLGPADPNFKPPTSGDTGVMFTSLYDDTATTFHVNADGTKTTYVPAIDSANRGRGAPSRPRRPGAAVDIISGARAVIDEADFRYGGGFVNYQNNTQQSSNVLNFTGAFRGSGGTPVYVTNNTFDFNQDAPMAISPDGLLAGDPQRPLESGHPFFRGNVLTNNDINGLAVLAPRTVGGPEAGLPSPNCVPTRWTSTPSGTPPTWPMSSVARSSWRDMFGRRRVRGPALPTTRPGLDPRHQPHDSECPARHACWPTARRSRGRANRRSSSSSTNRSTPALIPPGDNVNGSTGASSAVNAGAGFIVGVDNGVDPPASPLLGSGMDSVIRFVGIPGNETTGQARVPVILTSLLDNSVPPDGPWRRSIGPTATSPDDAPSGTECHPRPATAA